VQQALTLSPDLCTVWRIHVLPNRARSGSGDRKEWRKKQEQSVQRDLIQQGPDNGVVSLIVGDPVSLGRKMPPRTLAVGTSQVSHHPEATKRFRISKLHYS
jgi:hypothetical protein